MQATKNTLTRLIKLLEETQDFDAVMAKFDLIAESENGLVYVALRSDPRVVGEGKSSRDALLDLKESAVANLECLIHNENLTTGDTKC